MTMNEDQKKVDALEEEVLHELAVLKEENNSANDQVINDAKVKIEEILDNLRDLLKDASDKDKVKAALNNAYDELKSILNVTRDKVIEVSDSEEFRRTLAAGKEFLTGTASLLFEGLKYGKEVLCRNDSLKNVIDKADAKVDELRTNENVLHAVDKAEEVTAKVNEAVFSGLKKIFNKGDE